MSEKLLGDCEHCPRINELRQKLAYCATRQDQLITEALGPGLDEFAQGVVEDQNENDIATFTGEDAAERIATLLRGMSDTEYQRLVDQSRRLNAMIVLTVRRCTGPEVIRHDNPQKGIYYEVVVCDSPSRRNNPLPESETAFVLRRIIE